MAWVAPAIRATGDIITAAIWNQDVKDNFRYLKGLDGVPTIESGLIVDNAGGDEYLTLPSLTTTERNALTPVAGMTIWNETKLVLETYNGSAWVEVVAPPVTGAHGAIPYQGASAPAWLAAGTSGYFLKTLGAGVNPAWAQASIDPTRSAPVRVLDTEYQNTTGKALLVIVSLVTSRSSTGAAIGTLYIGVGSPPVTAIADGGMGPGAAAQEVDDTRVCLVGLVPISWYYKIGTSLGGDGAVTLGYWEEITW